MEIDVVGSLAKLDFLFSRFRNGPIPGKQPAVDRLEVVQVSGGEGQVVWSISRDPTCVPTPKLAYGGVPTGWKEQVQAEALKPEVTYVLTASGCGFYGGRTFKILRGKIVSKVGNGDMPVREVQAME
ncbi:MAG TPA: hypothetical protein VF474_15680 [Phenylobacterium sp.]